jgi:hypothetical protein
MYYKRWGINKRKDWFAASAAIEKEKPRLNEFKSFIGSVSTKKQR